MTRKCTQPWCWGCGKAPSGETGEPPFCLGCGEMVGECGMSAGPCGLCLDHCHELMAGEHRLEYVNWDELEHKLMEDLYGVRLDSLDLGLSEG